MKLEAQTCNSKSQGRQELVLCLKHAVLDESEKEYIIELTPSAKKYLAERADVWNDEKKLDSKITIDVCGSLQYDECKLHGTSL
jgi:hypothetical protein